MDTKKTKANRVEELDNFQFQSFQEFRKAAVERIAYPSVDRAAALSWAQYGIYTSRISRFQISFLMFLPYATVLGFIIWIFMSQSWLMFLTLPLFLLGFYIFHPSTAIILGIIRSGLIGLTFIGLIYAGLSDKQGLMAITIVLTSIWYSQKSLYQKAVYFFTKAITQHEDLLCFSWERKVVGINFFNGNSYWIDWKIENGKSIHYKDR